MGIRKGGGLTPAVRAFTGDDRASATSIRAFDFFFVSRPEPTANLTVVRSRGNRAGLSMDRWPKATRRMHGGVATLDYDLVDGRSCRGLSRRW